jgi:hypothetical protein
MSDKELLEENVRLRAILRAIRESIAMCEQSRSPVSYTDLINKIKELTHGGW